MSVARLAAWAAVAVPAIVIAALVFGGSSQGYQIRLLLNDADGLRSGSLVEVGGVPIGSVTSLGLGRNDQVVAVLSIDSHHAPIGSGATVAIAPNNLLGENFVELTPGDRAHPQASGTVILASRVTTPVDLAQVLDVLDPTTREALGILVNEAGQSFNRRKADFSSLLEQLPPSLTDASNLLNQLVSDNHTLADLIDKSSGFIATLTPQRTKLSDLIATAGQAAQTVAQRDGALRQTLADAPATLTALQGFLAQLQTTANPLGPAARTISATAPALSSVLGQIAPFQRAASPTFAQARTVAPELSTLGTQATPVLDQANSVVPALSTLFEATPHLSTTLGQNIDQLMAILQGWSRAIQTRDGLTHVFRAKLAIGTQTLFDLASGLTAHKKSGARPPASHTPATQPSGPTPAAPSTPAPAPTPTPTPTPAPTGTAPPVTLPPALAKTLGQVQGLLNYLLGN